MCLWSLRAWLPTVSLVALQEQAHGGETVQERIRYRRVSDRSWDSDRDCHQGRSREMRLEACTRTEMNVEGGLRILRVGGGTQCHVETGN